MSFSVCLDYLQILHPKQIQNLFYVAVVPDSCIKYILVKYFFSFVLRCIIYSKALSSFPLTNLVLPVHVRIKAILDTETKFSRVDTFVTYQDYSPQMDSTHLMICSYVNWCGLCSSVRIENASSVSEVDWTNCSETRPYNMTVTNSAYEELYWESKSCCSGNLTIKYRTGEVYRVMSCI